MIWLKRDSNSIWRDFLKSFNNGIFQFFKIFYFVCREQIKFGTYDEHTERKTGMKFGIKYVIGDYLQYDKT